MEDDPAFAQQAWSVGAAGYVLKEASRTDLVRAIRTAGRGGRYLDPAVGGWALEAGAAAVLSNRELEVLRLVALGYANTEIAEQMYLSSRTVETIEPTCSVSSGSADARTSSATRSSTG
jgi:two-component system response regulator NreC